MNVCGGGPALSLGLHLTLPYLFPPQRQLDAAVASGHREIVSLGLQLEGERREAVRQRLGLETQLAVVLLQLSEAQAGDSQRQSVVVGLQVGE